MTGKTQMDLFLQAGRNLTLAQRELYLRELVTHRGFPAFVVLLQEHWEDWAKSASSQKVSAHRDVVLNCMGSMQAVERLQENLGGILQALQKAERRPRGKE